MNLFSSSLHQRRVRLIPPLCAALALCGCRLDVYHHVSFEHSGETVIVETDVGPLEFEPDVIVEIEDVHTPLEANPQG